MKTIEELRKDFEIIDCIKCHIKEMGFMFNWKMGCYTDLGGKKTANADWLNGAWFMFQELKK